jgi:type II secretory ATPase GspE/PulE/Tfp pilus assembly ATPase PilB-like protein
MVTPQSPAPPLSLAIGLSREFLLHHRVCPKQFGPDGVVIVALAPDARLEALDDIAFAYRCQVVSEEASLEEVERLTERLTTRAERAIELERTGGADSEDGLTTDVRDLANQPPVVRYVNLLVNDAHDAGASDIHLEATRNGLSARWRAGRRAGGAGGAASRRGVSHQTSR